MRYANYNSGGAEKSMLTLSRILKEYGYNIKIISLGYKNREISYKKIPLVEVKFRPYIKSDLIPLKEIEKFIKINRLNYKIEKEIKKFSPDIILTQHEISFSIMNLKMQKRVNQNYYLFIHGFEYMGLTKKIHYWEKNEEKLLRGMLGKITEDLLRKLIQNSKAVFFPSEYLKNLYMQLIQHTPCYVIYPFVNINDFLNTEKEKKKFILHINPSINKGIEITLNIAKRLKKEKFIVVGNPPYKKILKEINKLNNVRYKGYIRNMKKIYKTTKILLIPSIQPETYSLASIEAQASGCNIVTSENCGINAPKKAFVKNRENIDEWIEKIKEGGARFNNKKLKEFDAKKQFEKLIKIINKK